MDDIKLRDDFDLDIEDGDFMCGEATEQHRELLLLINKGELKQYPTGTVGVIEYLDDEGKGALISEISRQYSADGMQVNGIAIVAGVVEPDAFYPNP